MVFFCYFSSIIFVDIFLQIYFDICVVNHFAEESALPIAHELPLKVLLSEVHHFVCKNFDVRGLVQ